MSRQTTKKLYILSSIFGKLLISFILSICFMSDYLEIENLDNHMVYLSYFLAFACLLCLLGTFIQKIRKISYILAISFFIIYLSLQHFVPSFKEAHQSMACLESGHGVWDYKEHRCRTDCWRWTYEKGCEKE